MPADMVRDAAVQVLLRVSEKDAYLDDALDRTLRRRSQISQRGRRFLTQLVYGTTRYRHLCDHVLASLLTQPIENLPPAILAILRMGIFQAIYCNQVTKPAMVHTSVELAKRHGHAGTAKLVNAVLRRAPESIEEISFPDRRRKAAAYLSARHSMPLWLTRRWIAEFGEEEAEHLCAASNTMAPVTIRVNTRRNTPAELIRYLAKSEYEAAHVTPVPEELTLPELGSLLHSKWFLRGHFMMQDPASMLAAHLMEPGAGEMILDLCAAPGGKTTHLAQLAGEGTRIVAADVVPQRVESVRENRDRLELPGIQVLCADGRRPPFGTVFDRVLVDAPCSGLGTLRRHPDLKWRMSEQGITRLAGIQRDLLRQAAAVCKNGGVVVYAVCTFTPEETGAVANAAVAAGQLTPEDGPDWMNSWRIATGQYRLLPRAGGPDGFFLTRFRKRS